MRMPVSVVILSNLYHRTVYDVSVEALYIRENGVYVIHNLIGVSQKLICNISFRSKLVMTPVSLIPFYPVIHNI